MMNTVEVRIDDARAVYNDGGGKTKKALLKLIGPKILFDNIMEAVKDYEDACKIEGITPMTIEQFSFLPEKDREYHFYDHQYTVINRVLNEGWEPDYSDGTAKYYPYLEWDEEAAGGPGFAYYLCVNVYSHSFAGARRTYRTSELAIYAGKQFIQILNKIHSIR
jgi:hypothetical protein